MSVCAPKLTHSRPLRTSARVTFDLRDYPMLLEPSGWRLRSRNKKRPADFRTGALNLEEAKRRAKAWLEQRAADPAHSRKGGGLLETLAGIYLATPKKTQDRVARNNVSRLRVICREVLNRELDAVTCREVSPDLWQNYQRAALTAAKREFNLTTRYRENIGINAAVRAARCLFLPALLRAYKTAGLDVRPDAFKAVMLPMPYVPPSTVDDAAMLAGWSKFKRSDPHWLTIGLARFAGMRRDEICNARVGWIEVRNTTVFIALRDRPEEQWWTKTGKPYIAQVIHPELAEWLSGMVASSLPDTLLIPNPPNMERARWFEREPQKWLRLHGVGGAKPLHRLRGLYGDELAAMTADAVAARLAGIRAAQGGLGHTTSRTTEHHYLTPHADLR